MRAVHRSWLRALAVGTLVLAGCTEMQDEGLTPPPEQPESPIATQGEDLFTLVRPSSMALSQYQTQLAAIEDQETTLDVRFGALVDDARALLESGAPITIRVARNLQFTAVREHLWPTDNNSIYWSGTLAGEEGWVSILLSPIGIMGGVQSLERGVYKVQLLGNGLHALIRYDATIGFRDIVGG